MALDGLDCRSTIDAGLSKVVGGCAGEREVDRRSKRIHYTSVATDKGSAVSKNWFGEFTNAGNVDKLDEFENAILRDSVVNPEVVSIDISHPVQPGSSLAIERSGGPVANTKDIGCLFRRIGDLRECRIATAVAAKFEYMSRILDDIL